MRQKFQVIRDDRKSVLRIREYAVVDKNLHNVATALLREENFSLLYEEIYESSFIRKKISNTGNLARDLRTENFFPISRYAVKIAEAVMDLYGQKGAPRQTVLFFDDKTASA